MPRKLSKRLSHIVDLLPLRNGIRILEIGCGPGAAAREIARKLDYGFILAIDRSEKAINRAIASSQPEIKSGKLRFLLISIEDFHISSDDELFDVAFGIRVGALDGRHPKQGEKAFPSIASALKSNGKLFISKNDFLIEVDLSGYH